MGRVVTVFLLVGCQPDVDAAGTDTDGTTGLPPPATTSSTTGTTGQRYDQTTACSLWLDCVSAGELADLEPEYGPDGSCWTAGARMVEECDAVCVEGYYEACFDGETDPPSPDLPPDVEECSLEALAPTATSWVVKGEAAGTLPLEIGTIIEDYCSCHATEVEEFPPLTPLYYDAIRFVTHEDFHATFEADLVHVKVKERVVDTLSMPPLYFCGDGDFGSSIHSPDFEILEAWLEAEAPDAPTWVDLRPDELP